MAFYLMFRVCVGRDMPAKVGGAMGKELAVLRRVTDDTVSAAW